MENSVKSATMVWILFQYFVLSNSTI